MVELSQATEMVFFDGIREKKASKLHGILPMRIHSFEYYP